MLEGTGLRFPGLGTKLCMVLLSSIGIAQKKKFGQQLSSCRRSGATRSFGSHWKKKGGRNQTSRSSTLDQSFGFSSPLVLGCTSLCLWCLLNPSLSDSEDFIGTLSSSNGALFTFADVVLLS